MAERILIIENEETAAEILAMNLRSGGFEVELATNGASMTAASGTEGFDLVICDSGSPAIDAYDLCRKIKADEKTGGIPVILLTSRGEAEPMSQAVDAGADDFITKPYEFTELIARINLNLSRGGTKATNDPLTGLPGNVMADSELEERLKKGEPVALLRLHVNGIRPYREVYGREKFEDVIRFVSGNIREVIRKQGRVKDLSASLGGDSFSILTIPDRAETFARSIIRLFDEGVRDFYSSGDLERGCILTFDRRGAMSDNPIMTVSIGGVSNANRQIRSHWEAAEIAQEVLDYAITFSGSTYCMDRRKDKQAENQ